MRNTILCLAITAISFLMVSCKPGVPNSMTASVKIYGNCDMCKKTIEGASNAEKLMSTDWDPDTKMAEITFDTTKISMDSILKRIAAVGYDSEKFTANQDAYNGLHECCKYERKQ